MTKEFDEGEKMRRWSANLDNPEQALNAAGLIMVSAYQAAFANQRFGKHRWKQRGKKNTFGIIADFAAGLKAPKSRRFERRPVLMDTGYAGGLVSTISHRILGGEVLEVGANKPYADTHQTGGTSTSKKITEDVQHLLWQWMKTTADGKRRKKSLGWLLNKKFRGTELTTQVPARPFIGMTKQLMKDIQETIGTKVMEIE
jgi:phage gpG-like protein